MILDTAEVISTNTSRANIYIEEALYLFTYITVQHYFYFRWCLCRQIVIRPIFSGVYVAQSLGFRVVFSRYLHNIYHFFLDHCIVCPSSIYVFRFPLWHLESVLIFSHFALLYFYIYSSIFNCAWLYCLTLYSVCLTTRTVSSNSFYCYQYAYLKC